MPGFSRGDSSEAKAAHVAAHALSSLILEGLADLGYECISSRAVYHEEHGEIRVYCDNRPKDQDIEEVVRFVEKRTRVSLNIMVVSKPDEDMVSYKEHLRIAGRLFAATAASILREYLFSNEEHAMLILWSGKHLVIRGGEHKIYVPGFVYAAVAHTHPRGLCLPSHHDLRSAAERLAEGACCEAIVSPTCIFITYRIDVISLEDYDLLLELSRRAEDAKKLEEYMELLSHYANRLKSVRMLMKTL